MVKFLPEKPVKFISKDGVETIEVTESNYGLFLEYFKPLMDNLSRPYARRFNLDASDVRESFYNSLLHAIKEWKLGRTRKTLTFEKWYWWVANQRINNLTKHEAKERFKQGAYKEHLYNQPDVDQAAILNALVNSETMKRLISSAENHSTKFKELLEYMRSFLAKNYSRAKIMSYTVKALSKKHALSHERIYQTYRSMLQYLLDACKAEGNVVIAAKAKKSNRYTTVNCTCCGEVKYVNKKHMFKLIAHYGGLDELTYSYRCNKCNPMKYGALTDPKKGDETLCSQLSDMSLEQPYCSDSSLQ